MFEIKEFVNAEEELLRSEFQRLVLKAFGFNKGVYPPAFLKGSQ